MENETIIRIDIRALVIGFLLGFIIGSVVRTSVTVEQKQTGGIYQQDRDEMENLR